MKIVISFIVLLKTSLSFGLVPLSQFIESEALVGIKQDPFYQLFQSTEATVPLSYQKSLSSIYKEGMALGESCDYYEPVIYPNPWSQKQAQRSFVANFQYHVLDKIVKAIARDSFLLEMELAEFNEWSHKFVDQSCSPNMTVYSLKKLKQNFSLFFSSQDKFENMAWDKNEYTDYFYQRLNSKNYIRKELEIAKTIFKSFCSWGGNPEHYRMLVPYLKNPFLMAYVNQIIQGKEIISSKGQIGFKENRQIPRILCRDLICRKTEWSEFERDFPRISGSTSIRSDFQRMYCQHFSKVKYVPEQERNSPVGQIYRKFMQNSETYVMGLISLLGNSPMIDLMAERPEEIDLLRKESIRYHTQNWAKSTQKNLINDFLWEEPLELETTLDPNQSPKQIALNILATMGQLDRMFKTADKIKFDFKLNFSKNYLTWLKKTQKHLIADLDSEKLKAFHRRVESDISSQLEAHHQHFPLKNSYEQLAPFLAEDFISQVNRKWQEDHSSQDKMISIPVRFYLGTFALQYINMKQNLD